jgi:hypothetical protein
MTDDMEILTGPFGAAQLLDLMNNAHVREPLRRFAAQHYAAYVNEQREVVLVVRSKEQISIDELRKVADKNCPGTAFFIADSGRFSSVTALQERIEACARAYAVPSPSAEMEERTIDGKKVLVIGAGEKKGEGRRPH